MHSIRGALRGAALQLLEVLIMTELSIRVSKRALGVALAGALLLFMMSGGASAQTQTQTQPPPPKPALPPPPPPPPEPADPNTGALTFTGGLDVPTKYVFRGIVQEADSKLTLFPYGDLGISFYSGEGAIKSASVNFGVWNALLTGSSGLRRRPRTSCTTRRTSTARSPSGSTRGSRLPRPTRPTPARTACSAPCRN